jgi:poly(3-hydroxybutyrate) depolymerase
MNSPSSTINYNMITSAGLNRRYILRHPTNYDNTRPYRLIIAYHWGSGTASQAFSDSFYGLWPLSNDSTIFVAPDGIDAGWANTDGRDLTFTDDMLAELESNLCIDRRRIFANGFSYGGAMSSVLACQRANVFRGVALYAAGINGISGPCTPGTTPIAYFGAIGTEDEFSKGQQAAEHFAEVNGCTAQTSPTPPAGGHVCFSYEGCSAGYPVRFCPFDGDHTATPLDSGQTTTWVPDEVWTFFSQF